MDTLEDRVVPTTWTVTNTNASGQGSLAAAVQNANTDTSPAIINFSSSVFSTPQTITLGASLTLSNATEPVTIEGPTGVAVTISGNNQYQDFLINSAGVVATIQYLTISNGYGGSNNGGGFSIGGGPVIIDHCTISNNSAYSGGGMSVSGGSLLLENSTVSGNTTPTTGYGSGAGLLIIGSSSVTVLSCLFTQDNSNGINGGTGGGIFAYQNTVPAVVVNSTFTANVAASYQGYGGNGGAVACNNGEINLIGCTLSGNTAQGNGSGGGIWNEYPSSKVNLLNDIVWNNTGGSPRDISTGYNGAQMSVSYCLIGEANGGGVNSFSGGSITTVGPGNLFNVATTPAILGSLANNGGPTQSMMPTQNSPEVNAGGNVTTANAAVSNATAATVSVANGYVFAGASMTPQVSFVNQPANTTAGAPMSPVTVQITRPIDFEEYIKIDNEIMEVVGLTINASNGTATLNVERGMNGTTAAAHAANAPVYLVSDQRGDVIASPALPTSLDMGAVQSSAGIPTAGPGLALTMGISSAHLNGTITALTNAYGQATFNNLSVPLPGTYQLIAAGGASSNSFTVSSGTYPIVTGISPSLGSAGDTVTIAGTNFTSATAVNFGAVPASSFSINSDTSITATVPAGTGIVDVTVTNAVGTSAVSGSDQFSYAPGVTGVSPNSGNVAGGTIVTITGVNFVGVTGVKFGPNNAVSFTVNSPTSITATSPGGINVVDVTVTNAGGTSAVSAADQFTYSSGTANWIVTNTQSTGPGSLSAAVQDANATMLTPSLVTFDPTVFATPQTITLASSLTLSNTSQPVTIQGPNNLAVTISGDRQGNFVIQDFVIGTPGVVATIQNLTIANGNGGINDGGGLAISAGNVTIDHCTISNNSAYAGGGVKVSGGNALIENSVITGNLTPTTGYGAGAGLLIRGGGVTVLSCLFTQNYSNGINGGTGGAIYEYAGGVLTVIDSTFTGNIAASNGQYGGTGGAIASDSNGSNHGTVNLTACTITGNSAQNGYGGGIDTDYYFTMTLTDDIVWNNTASTNPDISDSNSAYGTPTVNYTLVGNATGSNITGGVGNILNVAANPPILNSLANNGGPTQTMAPVAGSQEIGAGGAVTTISATVANTTIATITVANPYLFAASALPTLPSGCYFTIQIDGEQMAVIGANSSSLTVVRGVNGTTAATHSSGASVYLVSDQRGFVVPSSNPPFVDIGAYQSTGSALLPTVVSINPSSGGTTGGMSVIIIGTNFTGTTAVKFGASNATTFTVDSDSQITATDPAGAGVVDVTVVTSQGTSATSSVDQFTYNAATTTSLSSNPVGPITQGTSVTFTATVSGSPSVGAVSFYYDYGAADQFQIGSAVSVTSGSATSGPTTTLPAGSDTITAIYSGGAGFQGSIGTLTIRVTALPPSITSVVINQDLPALYFAAGQPTPGVQRSMVEDIVYTFSEPVNISPTDPNVFTIAVASGWTGTVPTLSWVPLAGSVNSEWAVTFSGNGVTGSSIANGAYTITVTDPGSITAQSDSQALSLTSSGIGGATQSCYRLYGDINGDEVVNAADNIRFKQALATYNVAFDINQDGFVNAYDSFYFKQDLSLSFTDFTPTI